LPEALHTLSLQSAASITKAFLNSIENLFFTEIFEDAPPKGISFFVSVACAWM
jgi:hypothetical protein